MESKPEDTAGIERDILDYLTTYPDAQDTLDGIASWWLLHQKISYQAKMVRSALNKLVNSGVLVEVNTPGSQVRYKINGIAISRIRDMVNENPEQADS